MHSSSQALYFATVTYSDHICGDFDLVNYV